MLKIERKEQNDAPLAAELEDCIVLALNLNNGSISSQIPIGSVMLKALGEESGMRLLITVFLALIYKLQTAPASKDPEELENLAKWSGALATEYAKTDSGQEMISDIIYRSLVVSIGEIPTNDSVSENKKDEMRDMLEKLRNHLTH